MNEKREKEKQIQKLYAEMEAHEHEANRLRCIIEKLEQENIGEPASKEEKREHVEGDFQNKIIWE